MVSAMVLPSGAAMAFALGAGLHPAVGCPDADYRSTTTASLLSLLDAGASGARELAAAAESEFVQDYREIEAQLSAAGALRDRATKFPGLHAVEAGLSTGGGAVPAVASPASVAAGGGIKAAICAACWPADRDSRTRSRFLGLSERT
jgi:hypothetical protein